MRTPVVIAGPCPDPTIRLAPGERERRCATCDHVVVNLSAMTEDEAERAVAGPGRLCVQVRRAFDGRVLHAAALAVGLAACGPKHDVVTPPPGECRENVDVREVAGAAGDVTVVVQDETELPIPGVAVTGTGPGGTAVSGTTDDDGGVVFHGLPPGKWVWSFAYGGLDPVVVPAKLEKASRIVVNMRSGLAFVGMMVDTPGVVDTSKASHTTVLDSDTLDRLPH